MLDVAVPNVPFRKEILVTERLSPLFDAMVISFRDGIYFSQMEGGQIVGGIPIPNEQPGYLMDPTFSFLQHMSRTLIRYMPCLKHLNVLRQWTGFYDVTPDSLPIVGEVDGLDRFIQCHGFSGHGFMVAPMIAQLLSSLIIEEKSSHILNRLGLHRFRDKEWTIHEKSVVG
jgi:sarcosine oxidase subunit beta